MNKLLLIAIIATSIISCKKEDTIITPAPASTNTNIIEKSIKYEVSGENAIDITYTDSKGVLQKTVIYSTSWSFTTTNKAGNTIELQGKGHTGTKINSDSNGNVTSTTPDPSMCYLTISCEGKIIAEKQGLGEQYIQVKIPN